MTAPAVSSCAEVTSLAAQCPKSDPNCATLTKCGQLTQEFVSSYSNAVNQGSKSLPRPSAEYEACINTVGSCVVGGGLCADPRYANTPQCACVNSPLNSSNSNAYCSDNRCTGASSAAQAFVNPNDVTFKWGTKGCPTTVINCTQITKAGGSQNVISGNSQSQNCGGVVSNITNVFKQNPMIAVVLFIVLVFTIHYVIESKNGKNNSRQLPPIGQIDPLLTLQQ